MSAAAPDIDREMSLLRQKPENRIIRVVYRCRLCGAEYDGRRLTRGYLASEFANIVVGNVSGCASMRPHDIHLCDSGRVGLADLLGAVEAFSWRSNSRIGTLDRLRQGRTAASVVVASEIGDSNRTAQEAAQMIAGGEVAHGLEKPTAAHLAERLKTIELCRSGYSGVLGNGRIVDRRENTSAIPIQANQLFGAPAPKSLSASPTSAPKWSPREACECGLTRPVRQQP